MFDYRKYLRDAERTVFAKLSHEYCLDAVKGRIKELRMSSDEAYGMAAKSYIIVDNNYIR